MFFDGVKGGRCDVGGERDGWMWSYRTFHLFQQYLIILRDLSTVIHESLYL